MTTLNQILMTLLVICFNTIQFVFKIEIMGSEVAITPSDFCFQLLVF